MQMGVSVEIGTSLVPDIHNRIEWMLPGLEETVPQRTWRHDTPPNL